MGLLLLFTTLLPLDAQADRLTRATSAFRHGDYVRAYHELEPLAGRGNAKALGMLGFLHEHGYGAPQAYDVAADLYRQAAALGDPLAQARLGLMYDKGHGVALDPVLAYKWLNLAAARAGGEERRLYARFRDAVASKMSENEIREGQRLASVWMANSFAPRPRPEPYRLRH